MADVAMAENPAAPPAGEKPPPPDYPPNQTIYVNNISEKIKINNLVTELKAIFNQFGNILEIQVKSFWKCPPIKRWIWDVIFRDPNPLIPGI